MGTLVHNEQTVSLDSQPTASQSYNVSGQTITIHPTKRGGFTRTLVHFEGTLVHCEGTLVHYEGTLVHWCTMRIHWCTMSN